MANDPLDESYKRVFTRRQTPTYWLISARDLRDAAEIIIENQKPIEQQMWAKLTDEAQRPRPRGVYMTAGDHPNYTPAHLLYAFAIENAIKGLIFALQPHRKSDVVLDEGISRHHRLHDIANLADLAPDADDQELLKRLTETIYWSGRYPVSKRPQDMRPKTDNGTLVTPKFIHWDQDHAAIRSLYNRLDARLNEWLANNRGYSNAEWYSITTVRGLWEKAKRDLASVHAGPKLADLQVGYLTDAAVGLSTMCDWLWQLHEPILAQRFDLFDEFTYWRWLERQDGFAPIRQCAELAGQVERMNYPSQIVAAITSAAVAMPTNGSFIVDTTTVDFAIKPQPFADGTLLKLVYPDHRLYVETVVRDAIHAWDAILTDLGL